MASILNQGDYRVYLDAGFLTDAFRLDLSVLDGTDVLDGSTAFFDVTTYVTGVLIRRGREKYRQPFDAGRCTIMIDDVDGNFSVVNPDSIYWDPIEDELGFQPTRRVRVERDGLRLFDGQIVTYDQELTLDGESLVTVVASDDMKQFDNILIDGHTPTAQRSDERLAAILARPEINLFQGVGQQSLGTGAANLGTQAVENGATVQDYFQRVYIAEQGRIFIAADGVFTFQPRIGVTSAALAAEFSDQQDGDIPYRHFKVVYE
jgi:hypothetical protein